MHLYCIQLTTGIFRFYHCYVFVLTRQQNQKVRQAQKVGATYSKTPLSLYSSRSMTWKNTSAKPVPFLGVCLCHPNMITLKHDNIVNISKCMKATGNLTPVGSW